jgi:hypothetical protein
LLSNPVVALAFTLLYILKIASKSSSVGNKSKFAIPDIKITNCCVAWELQVEQREQDYEL